MVKQTMKKTRGRKPTVTVRVPRKKVPVRPKARESSGLLGTLGMAAGTYLGGPVGGAVGQAAGKLISKITGFGDYKVSKNSISMGNSVPTFQSGSDGMTCCHREWLMDVVGSIGFVNQINLALNPGIVASFPFLSRLASNFEEYSMEGLVFEYRPSSGSAISSSSSALGVVVLATDYDAANPAFVSKQQMESYQFSTSTVPFTGCLHPVECKRSLNVLGSQFVRTGQLPEGTDVRLYDMGNFQLATQGMQSAYTVGELWVSYDVRLRKPRLPPSLGDLGYFRAVGYPFGSCTAGEFQFGTSGALVKENFLGIVSARDSTSNYILLPTPGFYYISLWTTKDVPSYFELGMNVVVGPKIFGGETYTGQTSNDPVLLTEFNSQLVQVTREGTTLNNAVRLYISWGESSGNVDLFVARLDPALATPEATERIVFKRPDRNRLCAAEQKSPRNRGVEEGSARMHPSFCTCDECTDDRIADELADRNHQKVRDHKELLLLEAYLDELEAEGRLSETLKRFRFEQVASTEKSG